MSSLFLSDNYFSILPNVSKNFNAAVGDNSIAWAMVHETTWSRNDFVLKKADSEASKIKGTKKRCEVAIFATQCSQYVLE